MGREKDRFTELLALLPSGWEDQCREQGALRRSREIKTAEDLLRLIFLYLTVGKSFAGTSALVGLGGEMRLNKTAVYKRIGASGEWLKWLCEHLCRQAGLLSEKPEWLGRKNVCLVDGSEDVKRGSEKAYHRLHYCLDLFTLSAREFLVTGIEEGEKLSVFKNFGKDDVVVGDRGYGNRVGMEYLRERGSEYVLRLRSRGFHLYDGRGRKISVMNRLRGLKAGESRDIQAYYEWEGEYRSVRLCAVRKDGDSERRGLEKLRKTNQRKRGGKEVSEEARKWNRYIIVAASLGEEVSAERVLELYRMRWQIELAFKRLKTLFQYGTIPVQRAGLVKAWFYGKLLLAALCETVVNKGRFSPRGGRGGRGGASGEAGTVEFVEGIIRGAKPGNGSVA